MRIESSIITSLSELRAIEQQRIADERSAIERARQAELDAQRAVEQARMEAEELRVRVQREQLLQIEQARVDAEREARIRVETSEAAERVRLQAALEQQRMQEELELRRAEIMQKRPRWMIALTTLATVAAIALAWLAIDFARARELSDQEKQVAIENARIAKQDQETARLELVRLEASLAALDAQMSDAQKRLLVAQNDADRRRVAAEIAEANRQKYEMKQRIAKAQQDAFDKERKGPVTIDKRCLDNAFAKECLKHK